MSSIQGSWSTSRLNLLPCRVRLEEEKSSYIHQLKSNRSTKVRSSCATTHGQAHHFSIPNSASTGLQCPSVHRHTSGLPTPSRSSLDPRASPNDTDNDSDGHPIKYNPRSKHDFQRLFTFQHIFYSHATIDQRWPRRSATGD